MSTTLIHPDGFSGITSGLNTGQPPTQSQYLSPQIVQWAQEMGLSWFRIQLHARLIWVNQHDAPSAWLWGPLDDAIAKITAAGMNAVFPIRVLPTWAMTVQATYGSMSVFMPDAAHFSHFARQVALRYNGQQDCVSNGINYGKLVLGSVEVGNEDFNIPYTPPATPPTIFSSYNSPYSHYNAFHGCTLANRAQPARDPHFYASVHKATVPALRNAFGGLVGACALWDTNPLNYTQYMQGYYAEGCGQYKPDYYNFHHYSNTQNPATSSTAHASFAEAWQNMRAVMHTNGDTTTKIRCTEFGWQVPTDCTAAEQVQRYQYVLDNARTSGIVSHMFFYTLSDKKNGAPESSLMQWNGTAYVPQPAYQVVVDAIKQHPQW